MTNPAQSADARTALGQGSECLSSTAVEPRPNRLTPEIALAAATEVAKQLANDGHIEAAEVDLSAKDIAKHGRSHMDGYELARALDDWAHWDCHLQMAETLDGFSSEVSSLIAKAEKEWAERNSIKPPLPNGTHIKLKSGETGTIDGVYKYGAAKFCVKIDGDKDATPPHHSRRIINFEDATAITAAVGDLTDGPARSEAP